MKAKANPEHPFFVKINQLVNEQLQNENKSIRGIAAKMKLHPYVLWSAINKKTMPTVEHLERMADYFNVSTDWLLGRTGGQATNDKKFTIGDTFIHNRYGTVVVLTYYTERKASYRVHVLNNNGEVERMSYQYFKSSFRKIGHSYAFDEVLKEISKIEVQR